MNTLIQLKTAASVFLVALVCFGLLPRTQAVSPAPDGGYPGGNTAEGQSALLSLTTGGFNTAVGFFSLRSNTTGQLNTAIGAGTLLANTADENTATGAGALLSNTTGSENTANGAFSLFSNTTGSFDTAVGRHALLSNTTGISNTANGDGALLGNTTGAFNTAVGAAALTNNTTGSNNTANGADALAFNTIGANNTGDGTQALQNNTTGTFNTAVGVAALIINTTGSNNTANGADALVNNTTGNNNTALGTNAGTGVTTASNVICIGAGVTGVNVSNTTWIGNVYGTTTVSGITLPVIVSGDGQMGTTSSLRRFKKEIKPMDQTSEAILALKPVTFHYKTDSKDTPQFGLIAEEVAEVNPDLVVRDENGQIYTVRYDAVNAMLLNEFLKEHRKVEQLQKQVDALTAGLQKVSAQLELNKSAPQTVLNNQ